MTKVSTILSSDQAQTDPEKDVLGYAPFAKYLARSIAQMVPQNGIVIGIYAPWGSGKTTLLNFVEHYLKGYEGTDSPLVVHFNPWWFSGQDDLAKTFFSELIAALGKQDKYKDLRNKVAGYAELLGAIPVYGGAIKAAANLAKPAEKSISTLKSEVSDALQQIDGKILVVIDDIDRLTAEETRQLFRVVKAVADFPNVIYLLAFDRGVAAKALESVHVGNGDDYLEKIVQVPFELPMPDSTSLQSMLFNRLDAIIGEDTDDVDDSQINPLFNASYWSNTYRGGIQPFIETPRDVVRLTNTFSVTYPSVRGEVNVVDFIAIETLRVFSPSVYSTVRNHSDMFTGVEKVNDYEKKRFMEFHAEWFTQVRVEHKEAVKQLITQIFPKTHLAWDIKGMTNSDRWTRSRRIAHPDIFPIYFRLAPPANDLPNTEATRMVKAIADPNSFADGLIKLQEVVRPDGSSLARRFLERFEDFTEDFPEKKIPIVVQGLFDAGDALLSGEKERENTFWDFGFHLQIARIFRQLLRRLPEPERFQILKDAMTKSNSYFILAEEVALAGQEYGKYGGTENSNYEVTVTLEHLEELEAIVLPKIRTQIRLDDFGGSMHLRRLLHTWQELASVGEVCDWLQKAVADDEGLLKVLVQYVTYTKSQTVGASNMQRSCRLNPFWFMPHIDPTTLRPRVFNLAARTDLSDEQRVAVLQFLQEYEDHDDGMNTDNMRYEPRRTVFERYRNGDLNKEGAVI